MRRNNGFRAFLLVPRAIERNGIMKLPVRNKEVLIKKIHHYKKKRFPGKGGGTRLAEEIGVPPSTVSGWLNGSRTPTFGQIYLLAKAFAVSPLDLCGIRKEDKPTRNTADAALLRSLLDVLEYAIKHPGVVAKTIESINSIVIKEMEFMNDKDDDNLI
jgi:transcriptional regulator with XRE-family HTH domain